jgi:hypothetical protein
LIIATLTKEKSRDFIEAYHFQPFRSRRQIVRLNTLVPDDEGFSNPRYIAVEEQFNIPRPSTQVHDCRVMVGSDMYLVTGYWDRYGYENRSIKATIGLVWKGEITVVKAGRYIPYQKKVNHRPREANLAVEKYVLPPLSFMMCRLIASYRFIRKFKLHQRLRKRAPTMITL